MNNYAILKMLLKFDLLDIYGYLESDPENIQFKQFDAYYKNKIETQNYLPEIYYIVTHSDVPKETVKEISELYKQRIVNKQKPFMHINVQNVVLPLFFDEPEEPEEQQFASSESIQFSKDIYMKPINSFLSEGDLLGKKVIMMHKIGYINATKLCKEISTKEFKFWNRDNKKDEFIEYVLKRITQEAFGTENSAQKPSVRNLTDTFNSTKSQPITRTENSAQNLPDPKGTDPSPSYNSLKLGLNDSKNINLNTSSRIISAQNLPDPKGTGSFNSVKLLPISKSNFNNTIFY